MQTSLHNRLRLLDVLAKAKQSHCNLMSPHAVPTGLVRHCRVSRSLVNDMLQQVLERSRPRATFRAPVSSRLKHNLECR